ncbi:hypothetical protein Ancab_022137 [Ancistrocladus abbreviatus]
MQFDIQAMLNVREVMRRFGVPEPYEKLKELTRGRAVTEESMREFIGGLPQPEEAKANLLNLTPHTYIGPAAELARRVDVAVNLVNGVGVLETCDGRHFPDTSL